MAIALVDLLDDKTGCPPFASVDSHSGPARTAKSAQPVAFLGEVTARERKKPSVVENGVAFPHARTDLVDQIVLGIGRSPDGSLLAKANARSRSSSSAARNGWWNDYLICVGTLARVLKDDAVREALMGAQTAA
jgi:mannitol/fructose-specific phosphotransferase system IIA component (Ntr-type)